MSKPGDSATPPVLVAGYMALNFVSSCGIIWANKFAYNLGFQWATSLTCMHFFATFLGLELCARNGIFPRKKLDIKSVLPISLFFCGFVVFNNLSLKFNPVGVNQLLKVMTTPVIVAMQYCACNEVLPFNQFLSLVPVCFGIVLATVTNVEVNAFGLFWGSAGILSTSVYQILVKTQQEKLECSSPQLLYYQSLVSAVFLLFLTPLVENVFGEGGFMESFGNLSSGCWFWVLLSCVLAFLVNLSIFLVIGKTSPVSYNVLGHGKLTVILISGYVVFKEQLTGVNVLGIFLTLCGIFWYTHSKLKTPAYEKVQTPMVVIVPPRVPSAQERARQRSRKGI